MVNWEEKTDFEIDVAVTAIVKNCEGWDVSDCCFYPCGIIRYCKDPLAAWGLIVENKISIMNDGDMWEASIDFDGDLEKHGTDETLSKYYEDKNPLRAAMIVFLMIHEDKK